MEGILILLMYVRLHLPPLSGRGGGANTIAYPINVGSRLALPTLSGRGGYYISKASLT